MISVDDAMKACLDLVTPLQTEVVPLAEAAGRVLAAPVIAERDQPPFSASAMDGYAVRDGDAIPGRRLKVVGQAPAGHHWDGELGPGQALRIFTGAPIPRGADRVIIQEDVSRDDDRITLGNDIGLATHIRPSGSDFKSGDELSSPRRLKPAEIALCAAMNAPRLTVSRRPVVTLIATGDELVEPGEAPAIDQIVASNAYGLKSRIEAEGGIARILPIARDTKDSLKAVFALAEGSDIIVTIGGASVGDHDLVGDVAQELGLKQSFYKVAMRPGKPLMAGRLKSAAILGLPGNPVSSMVCAELFLMPMIRLSMGLPAAARVTKRARLGADLGANGPREHYMRSVLSHDDPEGLVTIKPLASQDSSLLTILSKADALLIRPIGDEPQKAGALVEYIPLPTF